MLELTNLIFFDVEVFKEDWIIVFKNEDKYDVIVNDTSYLSDYISKYINYYFVGFNNYNYDDYIINCILNHEKEIHSISKKIIEGKITPYHQNIFKSLDLMQDIKGYISLKKIMGNLGMNIKETPVSFDINRKLTNFELREVIKYCKNDVYATSRLFEYRKNYFISKFTIIEKFNLPKNHIKLSENQLSYKVLGCRYYEEPRDYLYIKYVRNIDWNIIPKEIYEYFMHLEDMYKKGISYESITKKVRKNPLQLFIAYTKINYGLGGLHGFTDIHRNSGNILYVDVSSYYPSLIVNNDFNSRSITKKYIYEEMFKQRLNLKKEEKEIANAYKMILNKVSGCMRGSTKLADYRNGNSIVINGQVLLTQLILELQKYIVLLQVNTDGIMFRYKEGDYNTILEIIKKFEKRFSLHISCDKVVFLYQRNISNYIMIKQNGTVICKGELFKNYNNNDELYISNSLSIISKCLFEYYINNKPIEETVKECYENDEIIRFQLIISYKSPYDRLELEVDNILLPLLQKVNRVFATNIKQYGKIYKVKKENNKEKKEKVQNSFNHNLVFNEDISKMDKSILDLDFYIDLCKQKLKG